MEATHYGKFLTTKEVARLLNVNDKMVYALVNDKGLPATKVTGKWLFPRRLVEEWLETHVINYRKPGNNYSSEHGVLLLAGSDDLLFQKALLVRAGNPKGITCVADLARDDITIVNRPLGTGTRLLLDYEIAKSDISSGQIKGYHREVSRHLDAGLEVFAGNADAAPAISAVAGLLGLGFVPLRWERFDLLIARERFFERGIQSFIGLLHEKSFRNLAAGFTGYDVSLCGKMLFPDNFKKEE